MVRAHGRRAGAGVFDSLQADSAEITEDFNPVGVDSLWWEWFGEGGGQFSSVATGSASVAFFNNPGAFRLDTGSTSGSHGIIRRRHSPSINHPTFDKNQQVRVAMQFEDDDADLTAYFQVEESNGDTASNNGYGFKVATVSSTPKLQGFAHNGTSETAVDLVDNPGTSIHDLHAVYNAGDSVEFFVDGVSQGSVSTGLPSGEFESNNMIFTAYLENNSAVQRRALVGEVRWWQEA